VQQQQTLLLVANTNLPLGIVGIAMLGADGVGANVGDATTWPRGHVELVPPNHGPHSLLRLSVVSSRAASRTLTSRVWSSPSSSTAATAAISVAILGLLRLLCDLHGQLLQPRLEGGRVRVGLKGGRRTVEGDLKLFDHLGKLGQPLRGSIFIFLFQQLNYVLNHFPPMVHITIALPISIQPARQKLLAVIPSRPSCPPSWTTWTAARVIASGYGARRGVAEVIISRGRVKI